MIQFDEYFSNGLKLYQLVELLGNVMVSAEVSTKKYRGVSYRFYTLSRGGGVDGERHRELGEL